MNKQRLREMLIEHEGVRLHPYRDVAGVLTIGVGRNLEDRGLTIEEVEFMLNNDIDQCVEEAGKLPYFWSLSSNRQLVIVDMLFNLGMHRLKKFVKMSDALLCSNYEAAANEMLDSKWARQVGKRAIELAEMMRYG